LKVDEDGAAKRHREFFGCPSVFDAFVLVIAPFLLTSTEIGAKWV
jgi:hypothetical protein